MFDDIAFLSAEWLRALPDAYGDLPHDEGATVVVEHMVTDAPDGEVTYWTSFEDGRLVAAGAGHPPDGAVSITAPYPVAAEVATGQIDMSSAFMQGRAKVAGDQAALLRLLAVTATPDHRVATARLAARTRV